MDGRPAKILDNLYLGSVGAAYQLNPLKERKITHILTVCEILPPKFPDHFTYKVISVADDPATRLSNYFKECVDWINEVINSGGVVFVHCFAGISRSSTITIAYLMRYHNMELREAHAFVRR
mmetsp:Transcript_24879/g.4117  ORF Transcript_24879/g.4117 Transcript_24879/m.4117 type:complete len:122 (+) Transcript_24879:118-483(+)